MWAKWGRVEMILHKQWNKWWEFISRDVDEENETKNLIIVLRLVTLTILVYLIVFGIALGMVRTFPVLAGTVVCFGLFVFAFYSTYRLSSRTAFSYFSVIMIIWILLSIVLLGWDCGVQHYLFPLLVISFFSSYDNLKSKIAFSAALCALRLGLYIYCKYQSPVFGFTESFMIFLQFLNSITIFICFSFICWFFSSKTQEAEKKLVSYNERLKKEAATDPLTKLMNRRKMMECMQENILSVEANQSATFSIALGDIDFFKRVNDTYGHDSGDIVLKELAALFSRSMENKGLVARWGGEEFLFLFLDMNGDQAMLALSSLMNEIRKQPIRCKGESLYVTMTFGLEEYDTIQGLTKTIKAADEKLYMGKDAGRNRIVY